LEGSSVILGSPQDARAVALLVAYLTIPYSSIEPRDFLARAEAYAAFIQEGKTQ